jgi:hypothetical protein
MVGSLANGLGNDKSDIDLVFKPKFYQDLVDFWTSRNRKRSAILIKILKSDLLM